MRKRNADKEKWKERLRKYRKRYREKKRVQKAVAGAERGGGISSYGISSRAEILSKELRGERCVLNMTGGEYRAEIGRRRVRRNGERRRIEEEVRKISEEAEALEKQSGNGAQIEDATKRAWELLAEENSKRIERGRELEAKKRELEKYLET